MRGSRREARRTGNLGEALGMASNRRRFAIWAWILGTATLAVGIGVATGAKLKTKSATVVVDSDDVGSATAKCKRGTKSVSGGFEGEPFDEGNPSPFFAPNQSSRTQARQWTGETYNYGGISAGDFTSFAYCREFRKKVRTWTNTESVAPGATETVTANCERGKAVSGGFDGDETDPAGPSPFFLVGTSRRAGPRAWEVVALNDGSVAGELSAQVNCRGEQGGVKPKQASDEVGGDERVNFELKARCSRKQRVVSGGFAGGLDFGAESIEPFTSMKVGKRGWRVVGYARGDVTAYAYCVKKKAN
jgi:hypothetical protein